MKCTFFLGLAYQTVQAAWLRKTYCELTVHPLLGFVTNVLAYSMACLPLLVVVPPLQQSFYWLPAILPLLTFKVLLLFSIQHSCTVHVCSDPLLCILSTTLLWCVAPYKSQLSVKAQKQAYFC